MRAVVLALATYTVTTALALACSNPQDRSDVDAGRASSADATAPDASALPYPLTQTCAPPTDAGEACSLCKRTYCCQSHEKVLARSFDPLFACVSACEGQSLEDDCQKRCLDGNPHQADYLEQFACLMQNCSVECGDGGDPCTSCMSAQCPLEAMACTMTPECFYTNACNKSCADDDLACFEACSRKHAAGKKAIDDKTLCSQARCRVECTPRR